MGYLTAVAFALCAGFPVSAEPVLDTPTSPMPPMAAVSGSMQARVEANAITDGSWNIGTFTVADWPGAAGEAGRQEIRALIDAKRDQSHEDPWNLWEMTGNPDGSSNPLGGQAPARIIRSEIRTELNLSALKPLAGEIQQGMNQLGLNSWGKYAHSGPMSKSRSNRDRIEGSQVRGIAGIPLAIREFLVGIWNNNVAVWLEKFL